MAILGAATIAALVLILGEANRQRERAAAAQAHSYDVMILARGLAGTVAGAEAALGRYVISGNRDRALGQLYYDEWESAGPQIDRLAVLTAGSAVQRDAMRRLRAAYAERGAELSLTALATTYGKNSQALARYYAARRAPALTAFNANLDEVEATEQRLLARRTSAATRAADRAATAARIVSVFGVGIVLAAILLGVLTVRALADRAAARAEADAAEVRAVALADAVARATDELREQEAKLRQVQKMEAVGQLTGGIAHDFNNMLAVVLGGLELARRHAADPEAAARYLDNAADGATRAAALTRRLLAFSREESLKPETIEPGALVTGMSDLLDRTLGDGVTTQIEDWTGDWRVHADRVQLENALLNLAVNARDAMDGRGELTIRADTATLAEAQVGQCVAGDYVTLSVADTGCGMAPEIAERVFEPFFTTKPAGRGTGLGLSQVFALVRQLGGEVMLDTAPGRGTTVTLFLPRSRVQASGLAVADAAAAPAGARPLRVLVVEDDPRVLAATAEALEELGHEPIRCEDPLAAPGLLAEHGAVDLVVSDVLMPRRTGPELVAELTARQPGLAVLYVTGYAGEAGGAAEFGGRPVLRKPFTLARLERAVTEAVAGRDIAIDQVAAE